MLIRRLKTNWLSRIFLIVAASVAFFSFLLASQPTEVAQANTIITSNGGTLTARVDSVSPTSPSGKLCSKGRDKPNFEAWITGADITIGSPESTLNFITNVQWRECDKSTESYAIFSPKFCPNAGYYGGGQTNVGGVLENIAWDCVKYIDKGTSNDKVNPSLGCAVNGKAAESPTDKRHRNIPGHNHDCTTGIFKSLIMQKKDRPASGNPSNNDQVRSLPVPRLTGKVHSGTRSSGSDSLSGDICQYFWYTGQGAGQSDTSVCRTVTVNYSWRYSGPYNLVPTINSIPRYSTDPMKFQTRGRVTQAPGSGDVYGSHPWEVARLKFKTWPKDTAQNAAYTDSSSSPCTYATAAARASGDMVTCDDAIKSGPASPADTGNFSDEPDAALGEVICYMTSVRNPTPQKSGWRHSNMTCSMSGRQPSVQVWGGDLRVVGNASLPGGSLAISTSLTVITQAGVNGIYGSWGEYGVFTNGLIHNETKSGIATSGMASGAGLNKGSNSTLANRNLLTFSNINDSCAAIGATSPSYGCFGSVVTNRPTTPQGATSVCSSGNVNLTGRNDYVCDGIFTISNDLKYANSYTGISKLPRVRIFAKSFDISENVEQIDPWLITTGTESDEGWINTCSQIDRNNPGAKLSTEVCGTQLRFNGPVYAGKIYLFRTAGSTLDGASNEEKKNSMNKSAEVFNLRPDAHLSSFGSGSGTPVATTDYVSELPPRF